MGLLKQSSDKQTIIVQLSNKEERNEKVVILLRSKCPHCGHWVSATISKNVLERFTSSPTLFDPRERAKANEERQKKHGFLGWIINNTNELYEETIELPFSVLYGLVNAVGGISALEHCQYCGKEINLFRVNKDDEAYSVAREKVVESIHEKALSYDVLVELSHFYNEKYEPELSESFRTAYSSMINNFTQIPVHYRRFVFFVDKKIEHLSTDCVTLPFNQIPKSIHIHKGLIVQKNTLYVLHPYKPDVYIPYDSLDVSLFDEEMSEFLDLMSKLGAKSLRFERYRDHMLSDKTSTTTKESVVVSDGTESVGGSNEVSRASDTYQKIYDKYIGVKEFDLSPEVPPYVPENMIWLPHRENWIREIQDRLEGRSRKTEIEVGVIQEELVSRSEKEKLELYMREMGTTAKYTMGDERSQVLKEMHILRWHVIVEFYPLSDYKKGKKKSWFFLKR